MKDILLNRYYFLFFVTEFVFITILLTNRKLELGFVSYF